MTDVSEVLTASIKAMAILMMEAANTSETSARSSGTARLNSLQHNHLHLVSKWFTVGSNALTCALYSSGNTVMGAQRAVLHIFTNALSVVSIMWYLI
jgi:hypothetical protein